MIALYLILLVAGAVLFLLASFGVVVRRLDLIALGLFFWILVSLLQMLQRL